MAPKTVALLIVILFAIASPTMVRPWNLLVLGTAVLVAVGELIRFLRERLHDSRP